MPTLTISQAFSEKSYLEEKQNEINETFICGPMLVKIRQGMAFDDRPCQYHCCI